MSLSALLKSCYEAPSVTISNPIVQAALVQREKEANERAAQAVVGLLDSFEFGLRNSVNTLRSIRKQEKTQAVMVKKLDRAFRYFGEQGNPLPMFRLMCNHHAAACFCSTIGITVPAHDSLLWEVPSEWSGDTEVNTDKIE